MRGWGMVIMSVSLLYCYHYCYHYSLIPYVLDHHSQSQYNRNQEEDTTIGTSCIVVVVVVVVTVIRKDEHGIEIPGLPPLLLNTLFSPLPYHHHQNHFFIPLLLS